MTVQNGMVRKWGGGWVGRTRASHGSRRWRVEEKSNESRIHVLVLRHNFLAHLRNKFDGEFGPLKEDPCEQHKTHSIYQKVVQKEKS